MIAANQTPALFTTPASAAFGPGDEAALKRHLDDLERATSTPQVAAASTLQLDDAGLLPGGYRYTQTAFKQVCALVSPGLYQHAVDMSGVYRPSPSARRDYSFPLAVKAFNLALQQRFQTRLYGSVRLLKNRDAKLVEGVMGPRYNYLGNHVIYDLAREAAASAPVRTRFHEASLIGRRVMIRFAHRRPLFRAETPAGPEDFFGGYHVSNSEVGGEASVRAATILLRDRSDTASLGRFPGQGGKLAHTGKDFNAKLNSMFQALLAQDQDAGRLAARVAWLLAEPMAMVGGEHERKERAGFLGLLLHRQNVQRGLARRFVLTAATTGADPPEGAVRPLTREALAGRTMWDLYNTLTREAKGFTLAVRETVEQAAFALLMGRLRPR